MTDDGTDSVTPPTRPPEGSDERPECAECEETAVGIASCDAGKRPVCEAHMDAYDAEGVSTAIYTFAALTAEQRAHTETKRRLALYEEAE
jgi:hypothetical protein